MRYLDPGELETISARIGEAAIDPALWPQIMDGVSHAVAATGAVLLQGDVRTANVPRTAGVDELITCYFRDTWHTRDLRVRGAAMLARGEPVITDQDIVTPEEMNKEAFYNDCLYTNGFKWFAGIGFLAGSALWALSIQRTDKEGPFEEDEKRLLARLSPRLTATANLSTAVGRTVLSGITNALELVQQPAVVLDCMGFVLNQNAAAEREFGAGIAIRNGRLSTRDPEAKASLATLVDRLRNTSDKEDFFPSPIIVREEGAPRVVIRVLSLPVAARTPFLGARALLTFTRVTPERAPTLDMITRLFRLTPAEARLAYCMASGISPGDAADRLGIAVETARNQLKAVFAKTGTHRQSELVALMSRL